MEVKETEEAINTLANKAIGNDTDSTDAMRFTQSALNLAHALATMDNIGK